MALHGEADANAREVDRAEERRATRGARWRKALAFEGKVEFVFGIARCLEARGRTKKVRRKISQSDKW